MNRVMAIGLVVVLGGVAEAQVSPSVRIRQGANGSLSDVEPTISTSVTSCVSVGLPFGVGAAEFRFNPDANFAFSVDINWTDDPVEIVTAICGFSPSCPVPDVDVCGPEIVQRIDYHVIRGGISAYTAAAGGGFTGGASTQKIATGTILVSDVLEITAPAPMTLELPVLASGDVFGAESFGNPDQTWGKAKILVTGTAAGSPVNLQCQVESVSVIPEQCAVNVMQRVPMTVPAGVSVFPIELTCQVEVDVKATSAGLFGSITGAATAGANFGNSLRIQRITGVGGAPLPANVVVRGMRNGVVLEDTRPRCVADVDDGSGTGTRDGGVGIEDLLYYLSIYDAGVIAADVDDGSGTGTRDGGVGIEDLLYYLVRYDSGC